MLQVRRQIRAVTTPNRVAVIVLLAVALAFAWPGWTYAIGGGELLNVLSGRIASTPQGPFFNPVLGYLQNLHLFRHAIYSPRPLYQTVFVDLFGSSAIPFHAVAFIYSFGSAAFLYAYARLLGIRWVVALWAGAMLLASSALALRWYMVEPGTTHNAVIFFALGGLVAYERFRQQAARRYFAAAFGAFALAAISYPSGIVAPLIPTLVEGSRALAGGMCADVRRELCRRAVPVLAIGMLSIALFVANTVTTNGVISIRTFTESGEGGAVIGTDYGRGAVTAIGAWAGSFWTVLPSTTLGPVNGIIETVSDAPAPRHVPIIAASLAVVLVVGGMTAVLARGNAAVRERAWIGIFAVVYGFLVWGMLAAAYLYVFTDESPNGAPYVLGAFLLSWGTPIWDTGNPYYLLTAPVVILAVAVVVDAVGSGLRHSASRRPRVTLQATVAVAGALWLLVGNAQATADLITRPALAARTRPPFVDQIKSVYPDFPRGSAILMYDRQGFPVDQWLWVSHGDSRRADRQTEYDAIDLRDTLASNVDWYEERFVGRQMSPEILELYTNLRVIDHTFIGNADDPVSIDALPIDDEVRSLLQTGEVDLDRLFAFVIRDFSTAIDVTDAMRDRLAIEIQHDPIGG